MIQNLIHIQRRNIEKEKAVLSRGSKIAAKLCKFMGEAHWVRGAAHTSGTTHWAAIHSVKNTLAQCI